MSRVRELATALIAGHALPAGETTDALHIAAAAVFGVDILLTWNCRHMANPRTLPKTRDIIAKAGYICPAVMTPKTYLENLNLEDNPIVEEVRHIRHEIAAECNGDLRTIIAHAAATAERHGLTHKIAAA